MSKHVKPSHVRTQSVRGSHICRLSARCLGATDWMVGRSHWALQLSTLARSARNKAIQTHLARKAKVGRCIAAVAEANYVNLTWKAVRALYGATCKVFTTETMLLQSTASTFVTRSTADYVRDAVDGQIH